MPNQLESLVKYALKNESIDIETKHLIENLYVNLVKVSKENLTKSDIDSIIPDIQGKLYEASVKDKKSYTMKQIDSLVNRVQEFLRDNHSEIFSNITNDKVSKEIIQKEIKQFCINEGLVIEGKNKSETIGIVQKEILNYGILTDLIYDYDRPDNKKIEEIRVYDWNDIRIVVNGNEERTDLNFDSPEQSLVIAEKLCRNSINANMIKRDRPFVRLRIGNSIRVSIMRDTVARRSNNDGSPVIQMTIRKQKDKPFDKDFLLKVNSTDEYGYMLIMACIQYGISTAFYGGTNSGKTGTMRAFTDLVSNDTRTITIAEIDEMNLRKTHEITGKAINSVEMWEIAPKYGMGFREAINAALTFTPETLILQEIKGAETVEVLDASTTGHQVITSLHAATMQVFGKRTLSMYKQSGSDLEDHLILSLVAEAFPIVVRMKIFKDGTRKIADVAELKDYDKNTGKFDINVLYKFDVTNTIEHKMENGNTKVEIQGKFKPVNFLSDELQEKLLENAMPKRVLYELKDMYSKLTYENKDEGVKNK